MPGLWWGEHQLLPDNRSFLEIVNGARVPPSAPDPMPRRGRPIAATARAFAFPLSWSVTVCAGVAILARIAARDAEEQLERLAADYAELVDERDRLRERVRELEQSLSVSQAAQDSPQPAKGPPDNSFGASSVKPGAAIIAFPGGAAASEQ